MTGNPDDAIDWSVTTWKGSRREQHQRFYALPFARKLELVEEMCDEIARMVESRRRRGLPYVDPYSGEVIRPAAAPMSVMNEASPAEPPSPG